MIRRADPKQAFFQSFCRTTVPSRYAKDVYHPVQATPWTYPQYVMLSLGIKRFS